MSCGSKSCLYVRHIFETQLCIKSNLHEFEVVPDVSIGRLHSIAVQDGADTVSISVRPLVSVNTPSCASRVMMLDAPVELLTKHGCKPSIPM